MVYLHYDLGFDSNYLRLLLICQEINQASYCCVCGVFAWSSADKFCLFLFWRFFLCNNVHHLYSNFHFELLELKRNKNVFKVCKMKWFRHLDKLRNLWHDPSEPRTCIQLKSRCFWFIEKGDKLTKISKVKFLANHHHFSLRLYDFYFLLVED